MATCELCDQEMSTASGCNVSVLHADGEPFPVFPHGKDPGWGRARGRCGDCGVQPGGFHHLGCDIQVCPRCRSQLISCACRWDETAGAYDADDRDDADGDDWGEDADAVSVLRDGLVRGGGEGLPAAGLIRFEAAAAPLRARHHASLRRIAEWALAEGRPCDLDVAALCIDLLERHRAPGGVRLDRRKVNTALGADAPNTASLLTTLLPEGWVEHFWSVITWLDADGQLHPDSDPLTALLEPLRCAGGLDANGLPMPPGTDVDLPCQCYLPHDPSCPPGLAQHVIGHDWDTHREFVVYAHLRLRGDDPPLSTFSPLFTFARRLRREDRVFQAHADEFTYIGRIDAGRNIPELSLYQHVPTSDRGFGDLVLGADGQAWTPKPDGRRKAGFRWIPAADSAALARCGVGFVQRTPA